MKADEWAEIVRGLAAQARRHVRADRRAQPARRARRRSAPAAPTGSPASSRASSGARRCDADEHETGGLFSKTVLPQAILAKAHMPDLAQVVPIFNVESIEPGERIEQLASRRKVEFESIDFNQRFLATVPADHDPIALRELFSPGFLDWATQIRNEVEFGITERQLYFSWKLGELSAAEYGTALDHAAGLFMRLRNEMEESGIHTYQPGPWHAGLAPFPDAAAS